MVASAVSRGKKPVDTVVGELTEDTALEEAQFRDLLEKIDRGLRALPATAQARQGIGIGYRTQRRKALNYNRRSLGARRVKALPGCLASRVVEVLKVLLPAHCCPQNRVLRISLTRLQGPTGCMRQCALQQQLACMSSWVAAL